MPISRRQFDFGVDKETDDWMTKIHKFLSENNDKAYNENEIRVTFSLKPQSDSYEIRTKKEEDAERSDVLDAMFNSNKRNMDESFILAIDTLVKFEAISKKEIRGVNYYSYSKPLDS